MAGSSVFPDFSSEFWKTIDPGVLARENLVSKIHAIELLEQLSPYRGASDQYFRRVWRSLDDLQRFPEVKVGWLTAALVLFGNVLYLPQALLEDAWRGLYIELIESVFGADTQSSESVSLWSEIQLFENDPAGMVPAFFHLNGLGGRLDHEKFPRVESTDKLADTILDVLHPLKAAAASATLKGVFKKRVWVLLVDKSLSGHSLGSDIRRLLLAQHLARKAGARIPKVIVLCQVLTEAALHFLNQTIGTCCSELELGDLPTVRIMRAIYLDRRFQITDPDTRLFVDRRLVSDADELCRWFSAKFLEKNTELDRMRKRSGDNLEFGYRGCGLTLVDYQNCPTDSLPILWHASGEGPQDYRCPYSRIHSRTGSQNIEPSADKWVEIGKNKDIAEILPSIIGAAAR